MIKKPRNLQVLGMWLNTKPHSINPKKGRGSYSRKEKHSKNIQYLDIETKVNENKGKLNE